MSLFWFFKMDSDEELKKQETEIWKNLQFVFVPIIVIVIAISFYQTYSLDYNKKKYLKSRNFSFSGKIIKKKQDGDYPRANRYVLLENYHKELVTSDIYNQVNIGDSVYKKCNSDSVYFCLKNEKILKRDYNWYLREKYYKLLNKK